MTHHALSHSQDARQLGLAHQRCLDRDLPLISLAPLCQLDVLSGKHYDRHSTETTDSVSRRKSEKTDRGYKTALGARIRQAREAADLSQAALARALNQRSNSLVSDWEQGNVEPQASTILEVARILRCDPAWLLQGDYQIRHLPSRAAAETPSPWPVIPQELQGDARLEKAAQDLIYLLQHGEADELTAILKNIEVFARDTRARLEPKRRRRAG